MVASRTIRYKNQAIRAKTTGLDLWEASYLKLEDEVQRHVPVDPSMCKDRRTRRPRYSEMTKETGYTVPVRDTYNTITDSGVANAYAVLAYSGNPAAFPTLSAQRSRDDMMSLSGFSRQHRLQVLSRFSASF
jgi:hypothetical protein